MYTKLEDEIMKITIYAFALKEEGLSGNKQDEYMRNKRNKRNISENNFISINTLCVRNEYPVLLGKN